MIATLRRLLLVTAGAIAVSASSLAQVSADVSSALSQGEAAYARGRYNDAVRWYRLAAEQGNAEAQNRMGFMYATALGVPHNDVEAVRWYRLASDQGVANAHYNLGVMYSSGRGVPQNDAEGFRLFHLAAGLGDSQARITLSSLYLSGAYQPRDNVEAFKWWTLAAAQGVSGAALARESVQSRMTAAQIVDAHFDLGLMYAKGDGVQQNDVEAVRWYRLAADQGGAEAQANLGLMYASGRGVPHDDAEAVHWYRLAADQGLASAQYELGLMYSSGRGVPQSDVDAYKWWSLAAAQGGSDATNNRDVVRSKMTPAQIAEGQKLAAEWRPIDRGNRAAPSAAPGKPPFANRITSTGTGFFVTADGHVLTNAHVVSKCAEVSLADGSSLTVMDVDLGSDLALLEAPSSSFRAPLMLRQGRGVRLADSVLVAGYPLTGLLSSGLNVTTGIVSALAGPDDDRRFVQVTAPVQPGNSGGPLLDSSGNVVGIVVSKLNAVEVASATGDIPQNVNFAISLGTVQAFLDSNNVDYQTRASSEAKSNADIAQLAKAATVQLQCRN